MRNIETHKFLPDYITLFLCFLFIVALPAEAAANPEFERFEKVFQHLEMETIEHKKIKMSQLDAKIIVVNFWASWCPPCIEEMPSLVQLSGKFSPRELSVVSINTEQENQLKNIQKSKERFKMPDSFLIVPDVKFKIADEFKFSSLPVTVIYSRGKVLHFSNGPMDFLSKDLLGKIQAAVK